MKNTPLATEMKAKVRAALERSWSAETSYCFNTQIAPLSYGQCAPTAAVLYETFGGEILKTEVKKLDGTSIRHFYNRIGGERIDFTADQFGISNYWEKLTYSDTTSSLEEARTEMFDGQHESMRYAFRLALAAPHVKR